jgi:hypothetical protein
LIAAGLNRAVEKDVGISCMNYLCWFGKKKKKKIHDYKKNTAALDAAVRNIQGQRVFRQHFISIICLAPHLKTHQFLPATVARRSLVALR